MANAQLRLTSVPMSQKYGDRILNGRPNFHRGRDSAFGLGVAISAAGDGVVVESGWHREYGNHVKIAHVGGKAGQIDTSYHSMRWTGAPVGRVVRMGETVGYAGSSALGSTGPHLHFGLWLGGVTVDPDKHLTPGVIKTVIYGAGQRPTGSSPAASVRAMQIALAARGYTIVIDNQMGAQTTAVLKLAQRALGVPVDGINGPVTWAKLKLVEDGIFDGPLHQTVRAIQADVGAVVDGKWDSPAKQTKKAVQRRVGTEPDGNFGPVSIKRLQATLGVAQTGKLDTVTVRAWQKRLNNGGL